MHRGDGDGVHREQLGQRVDSSNSKSCLAWFLEVTEAVLCTVTVNVSPIDSPLGRTFLK